MLWSRFRCFRCYCWGSRWSSRGCFLERRRRRERSSCLRRVWIRFHFHCYKKIQSRRLDCYQARNPRLANSLCLKREWIQCWNHQCRCYRIQSQYCRQDCFPATSHLQVNSQFPKTVCREFPTLIQSQIQNQIQNRLHIHHDVNHFRHHMSRHQCRNDDYQLRHKTRDARFRDGPRCLEGASWTSTRLCEDAAEEMFGEMIEACWRSRLGCCRCRSRSLGCVIRGRRGVR